MIRILLVDDHPLVLIGLRHLFTRYPDLLVVGEACNGQQLLDLLDHTAADVIVLDRCMPGLDALAVLPTLRLQYPALSVLVFATNATLPVIAALLAAGASGYVDKTASHEELVLALRLVTAGKRYLSSERSLQVLRQLQVLPGAQSPVPAEYLARLQTLTTKKPSPENQLHLSRRECEVLQLLAQGLTNAEMAERLFTSQRTVECQRHSLLEKTGARNTAALVRYALRQGLVD